MSDKKRERDRLLMIAADLPVPEHLLRRTVRTPDIITLNERRDKAERDESGVGYIHLRRTFKLATTKGMVHHSIPHGDVVLDIDVNGNVIGIELLDRKAIKAIDVDPDESEDKIGPER